MTRKIPTATKSAQPASPWPAGAEPLVRAIVEAPLDVTPRLVLADWLGDHLDSEQADRWVPFLRAERMPRGFGVRGSYRDGWHAYGRRLLAGLVDRRRLLLADERHFVEMVDPGGEGAPWSATINMETLEQVITDRRLRRPIDMSEVESWPTGDNVCVRLRHGFVEQVACRPSWFLKNAGTLFGAQPVTDVRLLGCEPAEYVRPQHFFWFVSFTDTTRSNVLATSLFGLLAGGVVEAPFYHRDRRVYTTRLDAMLDLSRACVARGRKLAKLPELKWED